MTFGAIDSWWWPYVYLLVAGWLATDVWRFVGVYIGGRISDDSDLLVLVRTVATALVAAVVANLIVFPSGELADTPLALRIGAAAIGFAAYLAAGKRTIVGILSAEAVLGVGIYVSP